MLITIIDCCSLRKVKMDQRKLMDNANTITDMAKVRKIIAVVKTFFQIVLHSNDAIADLQTQNTVYEIVSDLSSRHDNLEDRLVTLEDKMSTLQEQVSEKFRSKQEIRISSSRIAFVKTS